MQIWCLSNGSYSLKKCHNPFAKAIQPLPPYGKIPVEHLKSLHGASLRKPLAANLASNKYQTKSKYKKCKNKQTQQTNITNQTNCSADILDRHKNPLLDENLVLTT